MSMDEYYKGLKWEGDRKDMILSGDAIRRTQKALLHTGMMNGKFIDQITCNQVTEEFVIEAFKNFRLEQNPAPKKVQVEYVLGIMFSENEKKVLVIWKSRPAWQVDKLNGIGGKIEEGETPIEAMHREFREETGFLGMFSLPDGSINEVFYADDLITPNWKFIGTRGRPALFDDQPGSYRMHIFACHFNTFFCDQSNIGQQFDDRNHLCWYQERQDLTETIINLPLNLEILKKRGVPGFAWTVDIAMAALRENFIIDIVDPVDMEHVA
jgi:8-oxo-dGTP pyrophosphatase MutT (NUDIX family)